MTRIPINPKLLTWARERAGLELLALARHSPKLFAGKLRITGTESLSDRAEFQASNHTGSVS